MKSLVLAILLLSALQVRAQERFDIVQVYAESVYDSAYVSSLATQFLPVTRESYPDMIACLKSELMATGMFKEIKTRLVAQDPGVYQLIVTPKWKGNPDKYTLKEILLDDSLEAQIRPKLMSRLDARGVNIGRPFTFTAISRSIGDAMNDLEDSGENIKDADIWVRAMFIKKNEIRLVISKRTPFCPSRTQDLP